ncbi:MAG: NAD-dependent epimerase/dehydratase family protein [Devosia sp.]
MRIVLTGASGGIGHRLAERLAQSHQLTGIVRSPPGAGRAVSGVTYVAFADKPALRAALTNSDCVIHCALDSKAKPADFLAANKSLDAEILSGALSGSCRLYVYVSSQVVYSGIEPRDATGYREDQQLVLTPLLDNYTRLKIEGEALVRETCEKRGIDWLILRPTVVMGSGLAWSDGVVKAARFASFGIKSRLMNLIHADDLSRYVEALLAKGARNAIYNLGTTNYESRIYFDEVGRLTGHRTLYAPDWAMRLIGRLLPSTLWFFARRVAIDASKVMAETGLDPTRPVTALFERRPTELRATTLEALQAIQREQRPFRAHGQGYSWWFNRLHGDDRVVMAGYRGIVALEGNRVTAKAGTRLYELNEYLDKSDLALPTLPEFSGVSVGACFFVDVHGSSARYFSLYELIEEIKYLDEAGNVVVSKRNEAEWAALRARTSRFILIELTFRCGPAGYLGNLLEWQPDSELPAYVRSRFRENASTTIQWYPFYRRLLVYNINPVAGPEPGTSISRAPFRGLPYLMQWVLLVLLLRGRRLQIDRFHIILSPWKRLPLERLWGWFLSRPGHTWRDMEICVSHADGIHLIDELRAMIARGELRFGRRMGIGLRFSHKAAEGKDYVWIEFVSEDTVLVDTFIITARRICTEGVNFHRGKFVPPS